jgi:hypothetical protein
MNRKPKLPYIPVLIFVILVNLILSTHFITIFLMGVVFKLFLEALEEEQYYIFSFVVATFTVIEVIQGLYLFSLTITSIVIYYFVLTRLKYLLSSSILAEFVYILLFYTIVFLLYNFQTGFDQQFIMLFLYNFLIDSIIIGLFL